MSLRPITVLVTASGAPGTAALLGHLADNGERDVRLIGTDMSVPMSRTSRSPFSDSLRSSAAVPGAPEAVIKTVMGRNVM